MEITGSLVLRGDVVIAPAMDLEEGVRAQVDCDDNDFVVSRPAGRAPSIVVDALAADLLERFRRPRTIVEAVILFSRRHGLRPEDVLESAYQLVGRSVANRFLISADGADVAEAPGPGFSRGETAAGCTIIRPLQILDDIELYQVRSANGRLAALKILHNSDSAGREAAATLVHEAGILQRLDGGVAPRLCSVGEIGGRSYILLEWIYGVDAFAAGAGLRSGLPEKRVAMAGLCAEIARAYAQLHAAGVMHGDVHPRNVLVDCSTEVRLVDFGLAAPIEETPSSGQNLRGGIPFFHEPQYARALLEDTLPPPVTPAGEQFSVAALLYHVVTGVHACDFTLERQGMLRQLAEMQPRSFEERGLDPWPSLEAVLRRALSVNSRDRYPQMSDFADALERCRDEEEPRSPSSPTTRSAFRVFEATLADLIKNASLDGPWLERPFDPPPSASVNYGAAGVAHALHRIAAASDDASLLALADVWASRALRWSVSETGFFNKDIEIESATVGESSIYHSITGVFVVQALIAEAMGDAMSQARATAGFLTEAARPSAGPDLTTGRASVLLGSAFLLDAAADDSPVDRSGLLRLGERSLASLWRELSPLPPINELPNANYGIAHGWAGYLYSSLRWSRAASQPLEPAILERLGQLSLVAEPTGRGLRWPWQVQIGSPTVPYMSGWCNGTAGHVFLWTLAYRLYGEQRFLDLATGAAWDVWDAPERTANLCCGLVGRAYALLNLYRLTEDAEWLGRARDLALLAAREGQWQIEYQHSLYKGHLALPVLATDIENPSSAAQPMFEETAFR
jgi:eukaryotic-like serine/threonine-protein kinase